MDEPSSELLARWRNGDEQAAGVLFDRYAQRLLALARSRLADQLNPRFDAEDVVQSALRSFFSGAHDGRFVLEHAGDLWRLLVAITLHKLQHQVARHTAQKRSVERECPLEGIGRIREADLEVLATEPSPEDTVALAHEVAHVFSVLDPFHRQVLQMRLQGNLLDEIAATAECSQRTVRRAIDDIKRYLQGRYREGTFEMKG